jgi:hypothetical protein
VQSTDQLAHVSFRGLQRHLPSTPCHHRYSTWSHPGRPFRVLKPSGLGRRRSRHRRRRGVLRLPPARLPPILIKIQHHPIGVLYLDCRPAPRTNKQRLGISLRNVKRAGTRDGTLKKSKQLARDQPSSRSVLETGTKMTTVSDTRPGRNGPQGIDCRAGLFCLAFKVW